MDAQTEITESRPKLGDHPPRKLHNISNSKRKRFLSALAHGSSVSAACRAANIERVTAYDWRNSEPAFAAQWDDALEQGTDRCEDVALERAIEKSDTLLIFTLKGRRPEKWRDPVAGAQNVQINVTLELEKLRERSLATDGSAATTIEHSAYPSLEADGGAEGK